MADILGVHKFFPQWWIEGIPDASWQHHRGEGCGKNIPDCLDKTTSVLWRRRGEAPQPTLEQDISGSWNSKENLPFYTQCSYPETKRSFGAWVRSWLLICH